MKLYVRVYIGDRLKTEYSYPLGTRTVEEAKRFELWGKQYREAPIVSDSGWEYYCVAVPMGYTETHIAFRSEDE